MSAPTGRGADHARETADVEALKMEIHYALYQIQPANEVTENIAQALIAAGYSKATTDSAGDALAQVQAVVALLGSDHITPIGRRQIERVLDEHNK